MGDFSSEIFYQNPSDASLGLRYRGIQSAAHQPSFLATTYSDETCLSASIEYISDGNGNETVPVFVTKAGNKVYIPPSIADLLRDKPPDQISGDCEDEERDGRLLRIRDAGDYDSDSNDSDDIKIGIKSGRSLFDENSDAEEELDGIQIISTMRKASKAESELDFFDSDIFSSFWEQFKHVGPKLVPFLKTLGLYFVIFIPEDRPSLFAMTLKCLPILSLALFIVLHGIGVSEEHKFSRRILTGLVFSCMGDAFLIWPNYFLHGMAAFGVAHCFYIRAFGFQPLNLKLGLATYTITSSSLILILPGLLNDAMPMLIGVLIYSFVLTTMLWRAIARVELSLETLSWSKFSAGIGGISFAISDTVLALNQFYAPIPYHQTVVMATYYTAQLGIALSVITTKEQAPTSDTATLNDLDLMKQDSDSMVTNEFVRQRKNKATI